MVGKTVRDVKPGMPKVPLLVRVLLIARGAKQIQEILLCCVARIARLTKLVATLTSVVWEIYRGTHCL